MGKTAGAQAKPSTCELGQPHSGTPGWTRRYQCATDSNRLLATSLPGDPDGTFSETYAYEDTPTNNAGAHGSITRMPHLPVMEWDHADRLHHVNKLGGGDVYFTYDASGQRVRKVWHHSGLTEERLYLGGFEIYRRRAGSTLELERETLHLTDASRRVAMVETKTVDTTGAAGTNTPRWRYQLDNHLGSATIELDDAAAVISYEEYHPYGSTAFHTAQGGAEVSAKRYRYTGKERDEETGLYYHGARYYAPWLGRWTAADPAGLVDGLNLYRYSRDNPIRFSDPGGTQSSGADDIQYQGIVTIDGQDYRQFSSFAGDFVWQEPVNAGTTETPSGGASPRSTPAAPEPADWLQSYMAEQPSSPDWLDSYMAEESVQSAEADLPEGAATAGEAVTSFAVGFVKGAAVGVGLIGLAAISAPAAAVIGGGLALYGESINSRQEDTRRLLPPRSDSSRARAPQATTRRWAE